MPATEIPSPNTDTPATPASPEPSAGLQANCQTVNTPVKTNRQLNPMRWLLVLTLVLACTVFVGPKILKEYAYAYTLGKSKAEYEIAKVALTQNPLGGISSMYELVAKKISPSVVHIDTANDAPQSENLFFTNSPRGQGAGVIYSEDGYIVTNQHLVSRAKKIQVTLANRKIFNAALIGTDPQTDIAVLKIETQGLIAGEWAKDSEIKVGTLAWAVGSPFGLDQSVTSGIISGRHRRVSSPQSVAKPDYVFKNLIQTDTPINPGNSGGPLVNSTGKIMGINTSIIGGRYQGVCFAVPSEIVLHTTRELIQKGQVERGFLGVHPTRVSYDYACEIGLPDVKGAWIQHIERQTPASRAGLRPGDVIRKWNRTPVDSELTLFDLVSRAKINSTVSLTIYRNGQNLAQPVTIGSRGRTEPETLKSRESNSSLPHRGAPFEPSKPTLFKQ